MAIMITLKGNDYQNSRKIIIKSFYNYWFKHRKAPLAKP